MDSSSPPTNHALDAADLDKAIQETWLWFSESAYWTKLNFMLGIMQQCDSQLLFIMACSIKTMWQRERRRQRAVDEGIVEEGKIRNHLPSKIYNFFELFIIAVVKNQVSNRHYNILSLIYITVDIKSRAEFNTNASQSDLKFLPLLYILWHSN